MKKQTTKRALLLSALSLLLCVSMLIGSTFAWFTDSVTSGSNIIQSGSLDIVLEYWDGNAWVDADGKVIPFVAADGRSDILWEPGCTYEMAPIRVRNEGSLNTKLLIMLNGVTGDEKLMEVIELKTRINNIPASVLNGSAGNQLSRFEDAEVGIMYGMAEGNIVFDWSLAGKGTTTPGTGHTDTSPEFTIFGHMAETAGNEYQNLAIEGISITVIAAQQTYESDSFDKWYDKNATFPMGKTVKVTDTEGEIEATVEIPADAPIGEYKTDVSNITFENAAGQTTMAFDLDLLRDNVKVEESGVSYTVTMELPHPLLELTDIKHNGVSVGAFTYDPDDLTVTFTTNGFSPYTIEYKDYVDPDFDLEYDVAGTQYAITKGVFVDKNPAELDPSLKEADSAYIAVNFEKDGLTCYFVAERENTKIVAPDAAADYVAINGNYEITKNVSGVLYKTFQEIDSKEMATVLLLPGTYTEATTVSVTSSCDIIGLGDKDAVKVIKGSASSRHLFNCTGSKDEYIQVTLRNMYLDAATNTTNGKDNAAVQSIRKTKVKCYDLTIVKVPNNMGSIAFYVNAKTAVNGQTYPAYMYVENCVLNAEKSVAVVDNSRAGSAYFCYNNLYYAEGASEYTTTGSLIKNVKMDPDSWEW